MFFADKKQIDFYSDIYEVPFIVACGTHPDFRGKNIFSNFFLIYLLSCHNANVPFIFLHPFDHTFYRRLGFETVDYLYASKVGKGGMKIRNLASAQEIKLLPELFADYTRSFDIKQVRSSQDWFKKLEELMADNGAVALIEDENGKTVGYATLESDGGGETVLLSPHLNVEADVRQNEQLITHTPSIEILHNTQCRITHAQAALTIFAKYLDGEFVFELTDPAIPPNNGIFRIGDGQCNKLVQSGDINIDFSLDIKALTKYLFGAHKHDFDENDTIAKYFPHRNMAFFDKY